MTKENRHPGPVPQEIGAGMAEKGERRMASL